MTTPAGTRRSLRLADAMAQALATLGADLSTIRLSGGDPAACDRMMAQLRRLDRVAGLLRELRTDADLLAPDFGPDPSKTPA